MLYAALKRRSSTFAPLFTFAPIFLLEEERQSPHSSRKERG